MSDFVEDIELDDEEAIAPAPRREFLTDEKPDENGLYEHFSITVDKGQSMMRLDTSRFRLSKSTHIRTWTS